MTSYIVCFMVVWAILFAHAYEIEKMSFWWSIVVSLNLAMGIGALYWLGFYFLK